MVSVGIEPTMPVSPTKRKNRLNETQVTGTLENQNNRFFVMYRMSKAEFPVLVCSDLYK